MVDFFLVVVSFVFFFDWFYFYFFDNGYEEGKKIHTGEKSITFNLVKLDICMLKELANLGRMPL